MSVKSRVASHYTHNFHPYPAKFTPQMVGSFLRQYCQSGKVVLDPFCGSGTTLVESALNGMDSVGIDLNPVACIVSRAKSAQYKKSDLQAAEKFVAAMRRRMAQVGNGLADNIPLPNFPNRSHWFQDNVSRELARLKEMIDAEENDNAKALLLCAFSKIIVGVSNQDSEVRYAAKQKNRPDMAVFSAFAETMKGYLAAFAAPNRKAGGRAVVHCGNAADILKKIPANRFDFAITSPPYINTFDYYLYHKQRMFWLGYDHKPVRQNEIGGHHRVDGKNPELAKAEYFDSMASVMRETSRALKPAARFVMIIGDGVVKGEVVNMAEVISEICGGCGYFIERVDSVNLSEITKSFNKKFARAAKREHTIVLRNDKQ